MKILGIDEAGKGSLAGPLCVGGVVFNNIPDDILLQIKDSKKLSPKKRSELFEIIPKYSEFDIQFISSKQIDKFGINNMIKQAIFNIIKNIKYDKIIYDGNWNPFPNNKFFETCIKGEDHYKEIAAASIMAKVAHDKYMLKLAEQYPEYKFENNKGYGTKQHREAILEHGLTNVHRKSWHIKVLK